MYEQTQNWLVYFLSFVSTNKGASMLRISLIASVVKVKVENIFKGSLDSIPSPSPSVKIQIIGG